MTDYSKIDFSKCKLPMWRAYQAKVDLWYGEVHVHANNGWIARKIERGWDVGVPVCTFEQIDELKAICAKVDEFIASELKRIEEESLPPWRDCSREEAQEYKNKFSGDCDWCPIDTYRGQHPPYKFHTRAPKPEQKIPSVKAPEGWEWATVGNRTLCIDRGNNSDAYVPDNKSKRDAMLACVAAYDERHRIDYQTFTNLSLGDQFIILKLEVKGDIMQTNATVRPDDPRILRP
jgi:hypothetical protein